jgi:hypothetical protein
LEKANYKTAPALAASFDHLIGGDDERRRHIKAERFCCFQIDLQGDRDLFSLSPLFAGRGLG